MFWPDFRSPFWLDFDLSSFFFPEGLFLNPRCSHSKPNHLTVDQTILHRIIVGVGKPRKVERPTKKLGKATQKEGGNPRKKEGGKSKNGFRKSGQNIGNPYQIEDNNGAFGAAPKGWHAWRAAPLGFVIFHSAIEICTKKLVFIKARPNFWPQIENRLWVVLALNKKPVALDK